MISDILKDIGNMEKVEENITKEELGNSNFKFFKSSNILANSEIIKLIVNNIQNVK